MTAAKRFETSAPDAENRLRIIRETGRSILVEASAGTGKTYTLIEAILYRVFESSPPLSLSKTAALTFTEKAAGEMKIRLRRALESVASSDELRRARAEEALHELDRGEVTTIHSFCLTLLRERPFEAGIDPDFAHLDPAASSELANRVWNDWWKQELGEHPAGAIAAALRQGIAVGRVEEEMGSSLSQIARALYKERTRLDEARLPRAKVLSIVPLLQRWKAEIVATVAEARATSGAAIGYLREISRFLESLSTSESLEQLCDRAAAFPGGALHGATSLWNPEKRERIQKLVRKLKERFVDDAFPEQVRRWPALVGALDRLIDPDGGYLAAVAAEKRRRNVLDFDDLLVYARDLLRRSAMARAHFRRRFEFLAVDEFQDTDPLQMEIVLRLAAKEGGEADWRSIVPEPGRLFIVGDPKQSIYRFRRADVESYRAAGSGIAKESLKASRRSCPGILQWVNGVFGKLLREDPDRPFEIGYSGLTPWIVRESPPGERVVYLEPPEGWCDGEIWSSCEAAAVARDISERIAAGAIRARDAAILVRSNSRVAEFQEALDRYGISSVLEGGQEFYQRPETAAAVAALKAISNPHDAVSLYAALKSFLFSFSDEDLLRERLAGVHFRYDRPAPASERLSRAYALFSQLRSGRHSRSARDTLNDLYAETGAIEIARAGSQGLQAVANLERLAVIAGDLSSAGLSFGAVVRALESEAGSETGEPRAFEEEEDAVRILTVHKAKGLEFPVVYVTDLGSPDFGKRPTIVFGGSSGIWGTTAAMAGFGVETPGYRQALAENEERERAEEKRLFYVAATRAKDLLVISCWRQIRNTKAGISDSRDRETSNLGRFKDAMDPARLPGLVAIARPAPTFPSRLEVAPVADTEAAETLRLEIAEIGERALRLEESRSLPLRRAGLHEPTASSEAEDQPRAERDPAETPNRAQRIGSAVHEAMQAIVERSISPNGAANEASADWELQPSEASEVRRLVAKIVASDLFRRSANADRRLTELPVLFRDSSGFLVEGKIDLLFEESGNWVVVDYKTDRWDRSADRDALARERYSAQLADYATAVRALGEGIRVGTAWILSARDGAAIPVPLD
ncbi:MAG TPA: UvrD-helicase domain-containing protein [Thermoanaerobaculia bacterium]|nr:UvrD-helicase domain-containing protein [Thermoanaerobaculia bacterium]